MTHIALDNGFPTSAAFTKAFRDIYGEAPSEYRRKMREQQEPENPEHGLSEEDFSQIPRRRREQRDLICCSSSKMMRTGRNFLQIVLVI